jgi:hypothetical protein
MARAAAFSYPLDRAAKVRYTGVCVAIRRARDDAGFPGQRDVLSPRDLNRPRVGPTRRSLTSRNRPDAH